MITSFEATANSGTSLFGYFCLAYNKQLFQDIKSNLSKGRTAPVFLDIEKQYIKLFYGVYGSARLTFNIEEIENKKFSFILNQNFEHKCFKTFDNVKVVIQEHRFYFTGDFSTEKEKELIIFKSLNFDNHFLDRIENKYIYQEIMVNYTNDDEELELEKNANS